MSTRVGPSPRIRGSADGEPGEEAEQDCRGRSRSLFHAGGLGRRAGEACETNTSRVAGDSTMSDAGEGQGVAAEQGGTERNAGRSRSVCLRRTRSGGKVNFGGQSAARAAGNDSK
eukprot:5466180-Prymnesium_polylepis.1